MATNFAQVFGAYTQISFPELKNLAASGTVGTSAEVVSAAAFSEVMLELRLVGTFVANTFIEVKVLACMDGAGTSYDSEMSPYLVLPPVSFTASASSVIYHARFVPPQRFKIVVKNYAATFSGLEWNASPTPGCWAYYQGIYYQGN